MKEPYPVTQSIRSDVMEMFLSLPFLIFFGFIGFAIVMYFYNEKQEKERTQRLEVVAEEMGLLFDPTGNPKITDAVSLLELFHRGRNKKFRNMIYGGSSEVSVAIFDYHYTTGGGKSRRTHRQTIACFRSDRLDLADFQLSPENFLHKVGKLFGYQDINFDSHPTFSGRFLLRGQHESAIEEMFTDQLLAFLEEEPDLCAQGKRDLLIYFQEEKTVEPGEIKSFLEEGFRIYKAFQAACGVEGEFSSVS